MGSALHFGMATSADILGLGTKRKIPARWAVQYDQLCVERDRLLERDCSGPEGLQPKLDDLAEAAAEETQRSILMVSATATLDTIGEVLEAIQRIERGTYGICEITGEAIPADRLETIPWTRYSLGGQTQLEQAGLARRSALPALAGLTDTQPEDSESEEEPE